VIDVSAIGQEHIGKGALVLVLAVGLEDDFLAEDKARGRVPSPPTAFNHYMEPVTPYFFVPGTAGGGSGFCDSFSMTAFSWSISVCRVDNWPGSICIVTGG
jgi:hypothetical protein